jgi:mono/diheme cytochrome c family protein
MSRITSNSVVTAVVATAFFLLGGCSNEPRDVSALTLQEQIERGEYLVTAGGCHDCHSPKIFTAGALVIDSSRMLSGHPAAGEIPTIPAGTIGRNSWGALTSHDLTVWAGPWGISFASNLTPDEVTGTGAWLQSSFINAMRTGKHMGSGRPILPPMPWQNVGQLKDEDLKAIFAFLRSLKAVNNLVPLPQPADKISSTTM